MEWEDIYHTHHVLEIGVSTSAGAIVKGDFSFIFVLKNKTFSFVIFTFFSRKFIHTLCIKKSLHIEKILRILEVNRPNHQVYMPRI